MLPFKKKLEMDCSRLPPAPHVLIQLIDLCHKTEISFSDLESIITKDSALCAKVIAISNSAALSQWNKTRDLKQILVVLGTRAVKSIALTSMVHQFFSQFSKELGEVMGSFWLDALICAHLTRKLAELTEYQYPDEAHLAGLLHQMGQLVLLSNAPEKYQALMTSATSQDALLFKEQEFFGINSADLASDIIQKWGLESTLYDAVKYQHMPSDLMHDTHPLIKLTNLSSQLSNRINHTNNTYLVEDHYFGLNQAVINDLVAQATKAAVEDARGFGIQVDDASIIPRANIDDEAIRIELARKIRQISLLDGVHQYANDIEDVSDMMKLVSENLQLLFGFSSEIFFFPDSSGNNLKGISNHEKTNTESDSYIIKLLKGSSLIAESALTRSILSSHDQTIYNELNIIDLQIKNHLASPEFICLPLTDPGQLIGVIVIGCHPHQAEKIMSDVALLQSFAQIISDSFARQQKISQQLQAIQQQKEIETRIHSKKIAHEINNPLTIINNYLELISMEMEEGTQNRQHMDIVKSEIERVGDLLLQLNVEPLQNDDQIQQVDINLQLEKLVELFKPTFYKLNNIQSIVELDTKTPLIKTDINKLKQVITNLIKNSAEALTENGEIVLKTKSMVFLNNKKFIEVSISDNGNGVPDNMLEKLFSPVITTKGVNHSGLGLTIVNKLVAELNGHISYSTSRQGGAKFTILLPQE